MKLLPILLLLCFQGKAQFKIGNLTVGEYVFTQYLLDCYNHPDTVQTVIPEDFIPYDNHNGYSASNEVWILLAEKARAFNDNLKMIAISKVPPRPYFFNIHEQYLVPRKPSEADFIKWQHDNVIIEPEVDNFRSSMSLMNKPVTECEVNGKRMVYHNCTDENLDSAIVHLKNYTYIGSGINYWVGGYPQTMLRLHHFFIRKPAYLWVR